MRKLFSAKYSDTAISFSLLILRVGLGTLMIMAHGYDKLTKFTSLSQKFPDPLHIGSTASLSLDIFAEFFCSALLILGLATRLACIPLIIAMSVALFFSHSGQFLGVGERSALYLTGYIALLFSGPGKLSIDRLIGR